MTRRHDVIFGANLMILGSIRTARMVRRRSMARVTMVFVGRSRAAAQDSSSPAGSIKASMRTEFGLGDGIR
ncbi:hypothetical protein [Streptomyces sp. T028]|uniref:hypothetical protein n=1 Tax=Streptomyces sp. T028 TaxID=3394379 RepID=UPI003A8B44F7